MRQLLFFVCFSANAAVLTFTLAPSGGTITGTPASTVGWGFQLTVDPAANLYAQITGTDFCVGAAVSPCTPLKVGGSSIGAYTDYAGPNGVIASSGFPVTQAFNKAAMTGVGQFAIDPAAPAGTYSGNIVVTYDLFTTNPNGPNFDPFATANQFGLTTTAAAALAVQTIPEPATWTLLALALLPIWKQRRSSMR